MNSADLSLVHTKTLEMGRRPAFERDLAIGDYWRTPPWLRGRIARCATNQLMDPCPPHPEVNGLSTAWGRSVFVNPPYSKGQLQLWSAKAYAEYTTGETEEVYWLINSGSTLNRILIKEQACAQIDLHRRVSFIHPITGLPKRSNDRDSVIYIWSHYQIAATRLQDCFGAIGEIFIRPTATTTTTG